jgi:hypothetical protein
VWLNVKPSAETVEQVNETVFSTLAEADDPELSDVADACWDWPQPMAIKAIAVRMTMWGACFMFSSFSSVGRSGLIVGPEPR